MEMKTVSVADRVFAEIEGKILSGGYKQGEILTETKLSAEYGVSRTPIREAIRRLESENLIEVTGKGVCILGISREDIEDIYEIRMSIEGKAARRAAGFISKEALEALHEALELQEFYTERNMPDKIRNADSSFHEIIYSSCKSEIFTSTLLMLHKKTQLYRKRSLESADRAKHAVAEHREIYNALANGNKDEAERLAVLHVKNAKDNLTSILF